MRKYIYTFLLCLTTGATLFAQTGSVELKNGSGVLISSHASISQAYAAIPATLTQAYIIETGLTYTGAVETYPILFTAKTGAGAANTITLRPAAGVSAVLVQTNIPSNGVLILDDADYVVVDGRPGGTGTGVMSFSNLATGSSANTIVLRNGACFNTIRHCNVLNATTSSAGRGVHLSTSPSNPSGNSDNRFEYCTFPSGRYQFNSSGTTGSPNTRNTVFGCTFQNMIFAGVWGQSGTSKMTIDSCTFYCNTASGDGLYFGILFDSQNDTVVIANNRMYDIQNGSTGSMRYIHIRSVLAGGTNYTDIHNNFFSMMTGNTNISNFAMIEYSGSNPTFGRVANNTLRIGSTLASGGTSGNVGSSAVLISSSSALSAYEIKNNICVNERTGGTTGLQHVAFAATNINAAFDMDYNVYNSTPGNLVRYGTTLYADMATYQAAVAGNEANSNDTLVQLVAANDLHLTGTSLGNTGLAGITLTGITTDIDGTTRGATPYRGADENVPPFCSGTPDAGTVFTPDDTLCDGESVNLLVTGLTASGLTLQWQSSPTGVTYTDIAGADAPVYTASPVATTYYQVEVTCSLSGMSAVTTPAVIYIENVPAGGSISETHAGLVYTFSVDGLPAGDYTYSWNFGDGGVSSAQNPVHTYAGNGVYTVTVVVSNGCGSQTLTYLTNITLGMAEAGSLLQVQLYPNPASDVFILAAQGTMIDAIKITDVNGRVCWNKQVFAAPVQVSAKALGLQGGVYVVEVTVHDHVSRLRLVVQ